MIEKTIKILNEIPNTKTRFGSTYDLIKELEKLKDNPVPPIDNLSKKEINTIIQCLLQDKYNLPISESGENHNLIIDTIIDKLQSGVETDNGKPDKG